MTTEGFIPVEGGKVFYRTSGSGSKTPLLTLYGGPGPALKTEVLRRTR